METTATKPASSSGGGGNGASRTFHSLFGGESDLAHEPKPSNTRIVAADRSNACGHASDDDDADVWDDDFPSDANMESAEEDNGGATKEHKCQTLSSEVRPEKESRQSMSDWADNDDDEDQWKDALQARVDQLELVVEKKAEPPQQVHSTQMQSNPHLPQQAVETTSTPYAPPVDQRATLTLVPKTNLLRSISAPPAAEETKPASKLKAPQAVRSPTASSGVKLKTPTGGSKPSRGGDVSTGDQARKRSNSRDFLTRSTSAKDQRHPTESTPPPAAAASNSVFVRAVVARGNSTVGRHAAEPRIASDAAHVDKRAKADDRATVLALSDAETVRRFILSDVKKMSVERIIADAKRLQFLEELHRRQPDANEAKRSASASGGVAASSPTKKRAV